MRQDGFVVDGTTIVDAEPDVIEHRSAIGVLLEAHADSFEVATLLHHLRTSEEMFRQEQWDSSISHCRNFVEQLLADIARTIAASKADTPTLTQPRLVRDYLEESGFFDVSERRKLVNGVYGYLSEEGSHPGISTHSAARFSKSMLISFAYYLLDKIITWKSA